MPNLHLLPINDVLPNSICANFGKNNAFLVINQFHPFGGIEKGFSITEKTGQDFTFPQPIKIKNFTKTSSEINITASLDSTILILAMAQGDNMDLFVSFRIQDDLYSEPINMGSDINTPYRESTPMLTHDTKKLYFTSDRPDGFGGKDIYYSERLDALYTLSPPRARPGRPGRARPGRNASRFCARLPTRSATAALKSAPQWR